MLQLNVEAVAEVKVLTSGITRRSPADQAGCRSPLSLRAAPTGSAAPSMTSNATRTGTKNLGQRAERRTRSGPEGRDLGYSIGGPVGRPGGTNKLFFFYSHEYAPGRAASQVTRFRLPTAAERAAISRSGPTERRPFRHVRLHRPAGTRLLPRRGGGRFRRVGSIGPGWRS